MVEHDQSTEKQIQAAQISKVYPETNSKFAPEKRWQRETLSGFLLGYGIFSKRFAVSFREGFLVLIVTFTLWTNIAGISPSSNRKYMLNVSIF